jgi:hypothetical protein
MTLPTKLIFDDEREVKERQLLLREQAREKRRQENREKFPQVTAFFDEMNALFPGTRVIWAIENGNVVGNPPPDALEKHRQEQAARLGQPKPTD